MFGKAEVGISKDETDLLAVGRKEDSDEKKREGGSSSASHCVRRYHTYQTVNSHIIAHDFLFFSFEKRRVSNKTKNQTKGGTGRGAFSKHATR